MIKNKLNRAFLSMLLFIQGQAFCSQQPPVPQGILNRLYLSMPTAPAWMTNLTTNMTSSFSSLSDKTKYLIYGAMVAVWGYIGYKIFSSSSSSPSMEIPELMYDRILYKPDEIGELTDPKNCWNIVTIIAYYFYVQGSRDPYQRHEDAFRRFVCPILKKYEEYLSLEGNWKSFLTVISDGSQQDFESQQDLEFKTVKLEFKMTLKEVGEKMFHLIKYTCPNKEITEPLKQLLIKEYPMDRELARTLNQ